MKTKIFTLMMAIATMLLVACDPNSPQKVIERQLVGVWGMSYEDSENPSYRLYFKFYKNGSVERLRFWKGDKQYYDCYIGSYKVDEDNFLCITYTSEKIFFSLDDNILRVSTAKTGKLNEYWELVEISQDKISVLDNDDDNVYFYRLEDVPAEWNEEYFEPEKQLTSSALVGQWDKVNTFTMKEDGSFSWWAQFEPEYYGMKLLNNGNVEWMHFGNWLSDWCENNLSLPYNWSYTHNAKDMGWSYANKVLTFSCSYIKIDELDDENYVKSTTPYTLDPPASGDFSVVSYTGRFLILYSEDDDTFYTLAPGTKAPGSAPARITPSAPTKDIHSGKGTSKSVDKIAL